MRPHASAPAALLAGLALLAACRQQGETPPPQSPPPPSRQAVEAPAAQPDAGKAIDATSVVEQASPASPSTDFDQRAFAGRFAGGGGLLELRGDGSYTLTVHAESADADLASDGSWTVDAAGKRLLLDPGSKSEPDRRFEIASMDELRPITADGSAAAALRRQR